MPDTPSQTFLPHAANLRRVFMLRAIEIATLLPTLALARLTFRLPVPLAPALSAIAILILANLFTWWRLHRSWPVTDGEFLAQLLVDIAAITLLLYYAGGSTNPLVSLYLVPLVIAAITLPPALTWIIAAITTGSYTLLMFQYHPLMPPDGDFRTAAYLHLTGMWLTFVLSAFLIAFFVARMAGAIRERDRLLAAAREETLRNERIVALGTLAAGAAHELGTPLATMAVISGELLRAGTTDSEQQADLRLLREQVDVCKSILSGLLASAGQARGEDARIMGLDRFLSELLDKWRLMRPEVRADMSWPSQPAPEILADQTLMQALLNLLNNAADASPRHVEVRGDWRDDILRLTILDRGPGLAPDALQHAGQPFFTTKGHGLGIGLFLANATIARFGGTASLRNREGGGAVTEVSIPLSNLTPGK